MRDPGEPSGEEEESDDIEVERMPDIDDWEFFRAVDGGEDRWLMALRYRFEARQVDYAFWTDVTKDPQATGALDARESKKAAWSKAIRDIAKERAESVEDETRAEIIVDLLERADPTFADYEDRLVFSIESNESNDEELDDDDT